MANERFVVSRNPITGHYTVTKEDTTGRIRTTELANFKQIETWIMMSAEDKDFARKVCERMAEHYENIIREETKHEGRNQSEG